MERIWAPWRMPYIISTVKQEVESCVFCHMLSEQNDEKNLILRRTSFGFIVMNLFPYNVGHLMVVPNDHGGDFASLSGEAHSEIGKLLHEAKLALDEHFHPHGFNIGMNLGRSAGAGIVDHLHYHIVPRWNGDANFMSTVGETKILSESLPDTYRRLKTSFPDATAD